jgi:hypothetical protein
MSGQTQTVVSSLRLPSKVTVIRTAMIGGGLAYDVYVPVKQVPLFQKYRSFFTEIMREGKSYVRFEEATVSEEHLSMPQGWDRYDDWKRHDKEARRMMLDLAEQAFPELSKVRVKTDSLPLLWVTGLLYPKPETSDEKIVEVQS